MSTLPTLSQEDVPAQLKSEPPDEAVYSVGQLNRLVRLQLEDRFRSIWIQGELSDVSRPTSGHVYFTLCDEEENAQIRGVIFRSDAARAKAKLENGARVKLRGTVSLFEPRGSYQLIARIALPFGLGDLHAQFEAVRRKLEAEGLLDADRKRALPRVPKVVGVVTSKTGAALHDIIVVAQKRCPTRIVLAPCIVQGAEARDSIIAALTAIQQIPDLSVVIVGRGGGAAEDLIAYNDEAVARAVAACRVPIISAVGHEVDVSITDLVADVRAATPSNAAELAVPDREVLLAELQASAHRLQHTMQMRLSHARLRMDRASGRLRDPRTVLSAGRNRLHQFQQRIEQLCRARMQQNRKALGEQVDRLGRFNPRLRTAQKRAALERFDGRLVSAMRTLHSGKRSRLATMLARLDNLSPLAVLARGYAIALHEKTGRALLAASDAKPGDTIELRLHKGSLKTRVES